MEDFETLLFSRCVRSPKRVVENMDSDRYKELNDMLSGIGEDAAKDILQELDDLDITSLDEDEYEELLIIIRDTEADVSNVEYIASFDFDARVDNGSDTFLSEKPGAKMKTANMDRTKHKMSANAIPKSKLKAARIKNRLKNFKQRIEQKKYYKQNKAALKRYGKSYRTAVKTGRHKVAIRRKS